MNETKEQIRHDLYDYVANQIGTFTKESSAKIKEFMLAHDKAEAKTNIDARKKLEFTQRKISQYYQKAKLIKGNPKIEGNAEALLMCLNWLNSDGE